MNEQKNLCARILECYHVADSVHPDEIKNLKKYKSNLYDLACVFSFDYNGRHYYISDDQSLMDSLHYLKQVLLEFDPKINGSALKNPIPQSDGALYALGFKGLEYYLWECLEKG